MKTIESILRKEMNQLKKIIDEVEKRLKGAPNGHLRISKNRGRTEYYFKDEVSSAARGNGRYMKASERKLVKGIAQRDYDMQVIITERGEWVRSKSEKIIADKLYLLGIPYR